MTLWTSKEPLFSMRRLQKVAISYSFNRIPFFQIVTLHPHPRPEKIQQPATPYQLYDFTEDSDLYDIKDPTMAENFQVTQYEPKFLTEMKAQDPFFPYIIPGSPYFDNPPMGFIAFELRSLEITRVEPALDKFGIAILNKVDTPMVELLFGKEIFCCLKEDLKVVTSDVITSMGKSKLLYPFE